MRDTYWREPSKEPLKEEFGAEAPETSISEILWLPVKREGLCQGMIQEHALTVLLSIPLAFHPSDSSTSWGGEGCLCGTRSCFLPEWKYLFIQIICIVSIPSGIPWCSFKFLEINSYTLSYEIFLLLLKEHTRVHQPQCQITYRLDMFHFSPGLFLGPSKI